VTFHLSCFSLILHLLFRSKECSFLLRLPTQRSLMARVHSLTEELARTKHAKSQLACDMAKKQKKYALPPSFSVLNTAWCTQRVSYLRYQDDAKRFQADLASANKDLELSEDIDAKFEALLATAKADNKKIAKAAKDELTQQLAPGPRPPPPHPTRCFGCAVCAEATTSFGCFLVGARKRLKNPGICGFSTNCWPRLSVLSDVGPGYLS